VAPTLDPQAALSGLTGLPEVPILGTTMHIVSRKRLVEFGKSHKDAAKPLDDWYRIVKAARYKSSDEVKATFGNASPIGDREVVFNVAGNKYRLVVIFHYARGDSQGRAFIRHILTHEEYDEWSAARRKAKRKR
jgi:mRNA interferase HigB